MHFFWMLSKSKHSSKWNIVFIHIYYQAILPAVLMQACVNGIDSNVMWSVRSNEVKWDDISLDNPSWAKYPFVRLPETQCAGEQQPAS